jgi:hypothetical protein
VIFGLCYILVASYTHYFNVLILLYVVFECMVLYSLHKRIKILFQIAHEKNPFHLRLFGGLIANESPTMWHLHLLRHLLLLAQLMINRPSPRHFLRFPLGRNRLILQDLLRSP